jgi:hypothetical protein
MYESGWKWGPIAGSYQSYNEPSDYVKGLVFEECRLLGCRSYVNRCFRGTYCLHLQGRKIRERGTSVSTWLQTESRVEKSASEELA